MSRQPSVPEDSRRPRVVAVPEDSRRPRVVAVPEDSRRVRQPVPEDSHPDADDRDPDEHLDRTDERQPERARPELRPGPRLTPLLARAYAAHLRELADRDPALLVAHAYTRYLGDLSGGQILRGAAVRILGLTPDGPGLAFYDFPQIPDLNTCKADLRARPDALPLAPREITALVAEARDAFARNSAVFAELLPS